MEDHEHRNNVAFTLLELLIVVVIISLLAGLILPAVNRAREKARASRCVSNLRQVYVALSLYADENDDQFPVAGSTIAWDGIDPTTGMVGWMQQSSSYVKNTEVYHCPSDTESKYSYFIGVRAAYIATGQATAARRYRIANPHAYVLAGDTFSSSSSISNHFQSWDADKDDYSQNCVGGSANGSPWTEWRRHSEGQNLLFADGHLAWSAKYSPTDMTFRYDTITGWP